MLFNSLEYALFLPAVFALFWGLHRFGPRVTNFVLLAASYLFYGWWDYRFLGLIIASTAVDFALARAIDRRDVDTEAGTRRALVWASAAFNLGLLAVFKYYDFFVGSLAEAATAAGLPFQTRTLGILLPVGISFYTFQTLAYTVDVYRGRLRASRDIVAYAAYVAFFPQLVAGPIERAPHLLPQFMTPRRFDAADAADGLRQILWGLFAKVVVADNCGAVVDTYFASPQQYGSLGLALGAVLFALQIYADFAGYSNVAIGSARLLGFDLMTNFRFPYFSRDVGEFWRRWHISLSTWFRDYVYVPLGGSRASRGRTVANVFVVFLVSGLWHGANWTFLAWGLLHAAYFVPLLLLGRNRRHTGEIVDAGRWLPRARTLAQIVGTFTLVTVAWVVFRAESVGAAAEYLTCALTGHGGVLGPVARPMSTGLALAAAAVLIGVEWWGRDSRYGFGAIVTAVPRPVRYAAYYGLAGAIAFLGQREQAFIYFQF